MIRRPRPAVLGPIAALLGACVILPSCAGTGNPNASSAPHATASASGARAASSFPEPGALDPASAVRATPVILSQDPWDFAGRPGVVIRTPHFRIYTTESDLAMRDRMAVFVEYALAHYRTAVTLLPAPTMKLDVYLMDNRAQWEMLTKRLMGAAGASLSNIERGGFAARGIGVYYDLGLHDTLAIASHEGWHQYTQRTFRDPLPVWLEEGMATYMEGHRAGLGGSGPPDFLAWANLERYDRLREAVRAGREIPLSRLVNMRPQDELGGAGNTLLDFYAHVWALTLFLAQGESGQYRASLDALLTDAADGKLRKALVAALGAKQAQETLTRRVGDGVYRAYFGSDMDEANRAFHRFIETIIRTGGREDVVQGRSPLDK